jgi:hypothetical protein
LNAPKSSRAIINVNVELKTNVSENFSVSIIRVSDNMSPMTETSKSLNRFVFNRTLTQLIAGEGFSTFVVMLISCINDGNIFC